MENVKAYSRIKELAEKAVGYLRDSLGNETNCQRNADRYIERAIALDPDDPYLDNLKQAVQELDVDSAYMDAMMI